jgi:hypothetical protein
MLFLLVSLAAPFSTDIDYICYEETGDQFCMEEVGSFNAWKNHPDNGGVPLGTAYLVTKDGYCTEACSDPAEAVFAPFSEVISDLLPNYRVIIRFFDVPSTDPEEPSYFTLSDLQDHHLVLLDASYTITPSQAATLEDIFSLARRWIHGDFRSSQSRDTNSLDMWPPGLGGSGPLTLPGERSDPEKIHQYVDGLWLVGYFDIAATLTLRNLYLTMDQITLVHPENLAPTEAFVLQDLYSSVSSSVHWINLTVILPYSNWRNDADWNFPPYEDPINVTITPTAITIGPRFLHSTQTVELLEVRTSRIADGGLSIMLLGESEYPFHVIVDAVPAGEGQLFLRDIRLILRPTFGDPFQFTRWPMPTLTPVETATMSPLETATPLATETPPVTATIEETLHGVPPAPPYIEPTIPPMTLPATETPTVSAWPDGDANQKCDPTWQSCAIVETRFSCDVALNDDAWLVLMTYSAQEEDHFEFIPVDGELACYPPEPTWAPEPEWAWTGPLDNIETQLPRSPTPEVEEGEEDAEEGEKKVVDNKAVKIMGGVVGGIAALALIVYIVVTVVRQRRKRAARVRAPAKTEASQ